MEIDFELQQNIDEAKEEEQEEIRIKCKKKTQSRDEECEECKHAERCWNEEELCTSVCKGCEAIEECTYPGRYEEAGAADE